MNEQFDRKQDSVYSKRLKAGKRRTYFFDVRATRANDYFLTITESRKRMTDDGYDRHKIFLYKEDFHKFMKGLNEAVDFVKTDLMPNFDFDSFNHDIIDESEANAATSASSTPTIADDLLSEPTFGSTSEANNTATDKADDLPESQLEGTEQEMESVQPLPTDEKHNAEHSEQVDRW